MSVTKRAEFTEGTRQNPGIFTCPFEQINSPGLYLEHRTGALLRVPGDAVVPGRSPVIEAVTNEPWIVTKIAEDPFLSLTKARMIAADLDLYVNF
ncbi:MAG TPA: hypothetical protein VFG76_08080 [Candidatus Polarisedimenticolia bacterium]|nr:hypothetical protein [Candidatus Polarisedimenticolia bacterium]